MERLVGLIPLIVVLPLLVFWAWMLRDLLRTERVLPTAKPYWLAAFIFLNIATAVFYYLTVYREQ